MNPWDCQSTRQYAIDGVYRTLDAGESAGGQAHGICYDITGTSSNSMKSPTPDSCFRERTVGRTLDTFVGSPECNQGGTVVVASFKGGQGPKAGSLGYQEGQAPTLTSANSGTNTVPDAVYALQGNGIDRALTAGCNGAGWRENESYTLNTIDRHGVAFAAGFSDAIGEKAQDCMHDQRAVLMQGQNNRKYIVRRLTPLECCRLQGFPDWWEDGVEGSDSARYKMWGNGIALPCAVDVLRRIAKTIKEEST